MVAEGLAMYNKIKLKNNFSNSRVSKPYEIFASNLDTKSLKILEEQKDLKQSLKGLHLEKPKNL